jgi:hypothetical protein
MQSTCKVIRACHSPAFQEIDEEILLEVKYESMELPREKFPEIAI